MKPYRERQPLATYPLRSSRSIYVVIAVLALMAVFSLKSVIDAGSRGFPAPLAFMGLLLATIAYARRSKEHRVAGGSGELRLFEGHLEVPPSSGASTLHFPYESLSVDVQRTGLSAISGEVLVLRDDGVERRLASRLFGDGERLREAAEDIRALQEGRPPPSRREPEPKNEWDDRLEDELDALD